MVILSDIEVQKMESLYQNVLLEEDKEYYNSRIEAMYRHYQELADRWASVIPKKKKEESLLLCGHSVGYHRTSTSGTRYCGKCKEVVG